MPLIIKDYKWMQTEEMITIQVPLKGVPSSNVDIFTLDNYIKASFPPFLFELFLYSTIDVSNSKCTLSDDEIIFELQKSIHEKWNSLTLDINKMEMMVKRREILEKHHQKTEEERKAKKEKLAGLKRFAVQKQIERDTTNRKIIDDRRNEERSKAMSELEEWKTHQSITVDEEKITECSKQIFIEEITDDLDCQSNELEGNATIAIESKKLDNEDSSGEGKCTTDILPVKKSAAKRETDISSIFPIPLPRNSGTVTIHFTHRDFPTPSRESQAPQEEEWLKKQVEARRMTGFVAEDLRPEECNPSWLKDKGDSFYKTGNFLGAVSAYSHAIKLGSKMASLYANRAAAHVGLGNFHKALDDCSQALELMTPHVAANLEARAKCHARRGAVLCRLGLPEAGIADFEEALKLMPNDPKLINDIEHAKVLIKNKPNEEEKFDGIEIIPS